MGAVDPTDLSAPLRSARELLDQGKASEAQRIIDGFLTHRSAGLLSQEDVVRSCGIVARLLALRGERVRARMMAELAVELASFCATNPTWAYAYLDQAHTLRALGQRDEALACVRRARVLAPADVPPGDLWLSCC